MFKDYYIKIRDFLGLSSRPAGDLGLGIDSRRDWRFLCVLFLVLVFIVLAADIYIFYGGQYMGVKNIEGSSDDLVSLDKARLDKTINSWRDREVNFNKLLEDKSNLVDPSI
jgi:hypothetical protein